MQSRNSKLAKLRFPYSLDGRNTKSSKKKDHTTHLSDILHDHKLELPSLLILEQIDKVLPLCFGADCAADVVALLEELLSDVAECQCTRATGSSKTCDDSLTRRCTPKRQ